MRELPKSEIAKGILHFCLISGIKAPNDIDLDAIIEHIQKEKGHVWVETMKAGMNKWIDGVYPDVRRPSYFNAHFFSSILEAHFKTLSTSTRISRDIEDEQPITPEKRDNIMMNGFKEKFIDYKMNTLPDIMWLFSLYDWLAEKGYVNISTFNDEVITQRIEQIKQRAYAERKNENVWDITPRTHDNLMKVVFVSLYFDAIENIPN